MSPTTIACPHCQHPISLDEALTSQIKSGIESKLLADAKLKEQQMLEEYEKKLTLEKKAVEERVKATLIEDGKRELAYINEQLATEKKKRQESEEKELQLRKKEAELEEATRRLQLDLARQMDEERAKIRESTQRELIDVQRQKDMEKDKQINDLKKLLEDAQRKANQGSQQTQGEVQELALEEMLRSTFRDDAIEPVGKGVTGADVRQIVKTSKGTVCGVILWESKQTKSWSEGWIGKLKSDLRNEKADIPVIVTSAFNEADWCGMTVREGVWICTFKLFIPLAISLRKQLIEVAREKNMASNRGEKADLIYSYVTSQAFRQQVEAMAELYSEAHSQIAKERAAMEKIWKVREGQSQRLMLSLGNIYGSIQGLAGPSAVPELPGLSLDGEGADEGQQALL